MWNKRIRVAWIYRDPAHDSPEAVRHGPLVPSRRFLAFGIVLLLNGCQELPGELGPYKLPSLSSQI